MYAIVHRQAETCSEKIKEMGFEVMVVDHPVEQSDIRGEHLRKNIHREWCCGHQEFIKLFAYTLPHEIVVHVDIDFLFLKPMDHLFDAILYHKDSPEGRAAREKIELQRPGDVLPDRIGAFITRDWPQVAPNKFPPAYQAGFLVARRDHSIMHEMVEVIKEGNYSNGWGHNYGWGNKGYGGYVGAMAMQGLVGYYYDHIRPNNAVELNQCRFNHMGMDSLYRHQPNFQARSKFVGKCRAGGTDDCEQCMETPLEQIYSVHYTMCKKPWMCTAEGKPGGRKPLIDEWQVNLKHCHELHHRWHEVRQDFENQLYDLTKDETIKEGASGTYKTDLFLGHCGGEKDGNYINLAGKDETFKQVSKLYD
uniref:Nucleotide-diphospho-sugar transferase domain-containing protein n=1 Tax=Corethron hystrix TaxID=216773 RepID=A0A7S1BHA7_9STRA